MPFAPDDREGRALEGALELRSGASDGTQTLNGLAAVYRSWSPWYGWEGEFREQIALGAFAGGPMRGDVRSLLNHEADNLLGRTPKTLRLSDLEKGFGFSVDLPDTELGRSVAVNVKRGALSGASFSFTVAEDIVEFDKEADTISRTIVRIDELFDVGPVTFPFYPDTSVVLRDMKALAGGEAWSGPSADWWRHRLDLLEAECGV